jgi:hypothetical protein
MVCILTPFFYKGICAATSVLTYFSRLSRRHAGYSSAARAPQGIQIGVIHMRVESKVGAKPIDFHSMAENRGCAGYSSAIREAQGIQRGMRQLRVNSKVGPEPVDAQLTQNASTASQLKCWGIVD